ncbi:MAG: NAD(P)H-binding protein [Ferruginibacter sp.]
MKILILGSTGETGQQLVRLSLEQDHEVTALARDPSRLKTSHKKLTVVEGNALDINVLLKVLEGKDAVLSALGVGRSLKSSGLITNAVKILIPAMNEKDVKRLIFISAFGVGETYKQANFIQKFIFSTFLKNIYTDKGMADELIRRSSLEWTLVFPVLLTNAPRKGQYSVSEELPMKGMPKISRADAADFILFQLYDNIFLKRNPILMN